MKTLATVAMTDLKDNLFVRPLFMNIQIDQKKYPKDLNNPNKFLKILNYNPFKSGLLDFDDGKVTLFDENNLQIKSLISAQLQETKIGILHSLVRSAPLSVPTTRFIFFIEFITEQGCIKILNDDLSVIEPVTNWLTKQKINIIDPMKLLSLSPTNNWKEFTEQKFMVLAKETEFVTPFQLSGSSPRV